MSKRAQRWLAPAPSTGAARRVVIAAASDLDPADLRSLDAIHLATAVGALADAASILRGDAGFEKKLVIKRILPHLSDDSGFIKMFVEEAKLSALDLPLITAPGLRDLQAVVMANMPPERFNYQQRVGRAGRRRSGPRCSGARSGPAPRASTSLCTSATSMRTISARSPRVQRS